VPRRDVLAILGEEHSVVLSVGLALLCELDVHHCQLRAAAVESPSCSRACAQSCACEGSAAPHEAQHSCGRGWYAHGCRLLQYSTAGKRREAAAQCDCVHDQGRGFVYVCRANWVSTRAKALAAGKCSQDVTSIASWLSHLFDLL
jgi:hypothetical protein